MLLLYILQTNYLNEFAYVLNAYYYIKFYNRTSYILQLKLRMTTMLVLLNVGKKGVQRRDYFQWHGMYT